MSNNTPKTSWPQGLRIRPRVTFIALAAFALLAIAASSAFMAAPLSGAIYTTDINCGGVDINIYPDKDAVYLNGGPNGPGGPGLPEGNYYVRVTEPDGTPLGSSIDGPAGDQPVHVNANGLFATCYQLSSIVTPAPGGGPGYNDTTNNGDEYKVWVCADANFTESQCKTDNFKVKSNDGGGTGDGILQVLKFYDADQDGEKDPDEPYLEGWKFDLGSLTPGASTFTNPLSTSFSASVNPGTYTATERDTIETNWFASTSKTLSALVVLNDTSTIEFGNYCTLTPGGHTIGFWSNKNGQNLEDAADFTELNALCLVNATGSNVDFTSGVLNTNKKNLNIWLLDAKATNMAYMLSAQLAATELSVNHGFTNASVIV
ncbi:MAG TPA: hypothetical protein VHR36_04025, partial [Pyrinomonadaceae bacterium]|nr:hypothetical protein [Pyrinomonadaceae bacterium]